MLDVVCAVVCVFVWLFVVFVRHLMLITEGNTRTKTYCEVMAFHSLRSDNCSDSGVREVITGMNGLRQPSVHVEVVC